MLKSIFGPTGAFKSWTFWGLVGTIAGAAVGHFDPSVSPAVTGAVQIGGLVVTAAGLRRAHNKTVKAIADLIAGLAERR